MTGLFEFTAKTARAGRAKVAHAQQRNYPFYFASATGTVAESGARLKLRQSIMRNNIVGKKISCKPQKLQEILVTVQICGGIWRKAEQAGRKKWLPGHGPIVKHPGRARRQRFSRGVQAEW